ncbi:MAG: methylenetetrahydrofolate reductase [NAD(P)H] [Tepidisphaeraceae bacterium]
MRLDPLFESGKPTVSFEFFPPKTDEGFTSLYRTIEELKPLKPSYVSVTYGAGGSTRTKTLELAAKIQNQIGFNTLAHLTCVGHTADEIGQIIDQLWADGVRNILALRGDPPAGGATWTKTPGGFDHADELVAYIKKRHDFFVAVAGFPEGHPQGLNRQRDLEHLKGKVDAGADAIVTQLFFDNNDFHQFRYDTDRMGIRVPIVAGIMPISNVSQIKRFVTMCGAKIPMPLLRKLERIEHDADAVYKAGIDYATNQCRDLIFHDIAGLHFYTLNKSRATVDIVRRLEATTL